MKKDKQKAEFIAAVLSAIVGVNKHTGEIIFDAVKARCQLDKAGF